VSMAGARVFVLKFSRSLLAFLVAVITAGAAFAEAVIPYYIHPPGVAQATVAFVTAVADAAAIYLSTEEQTAPEQ